MRRQALAVALTALLTLTVAGGTAHADDHFNYKNPWKPTKDVDEIPDSLYRGSGSNFKAESPIGGGSGAYQFIQSTWDAYVVKVDAGYVGVRPNKAPPYLQEEMFWVVANSRAKKPGLEGRHHWSASHAHGAGFTHVKDC